MFTQTIQFRLREAYVRIPYGTGTCRREKEGSVRHDELDVDGPLHQLTVLVLKHVQEYLLALRTHAGAGISLPIEYRKQQCCGSGSESGSTGSTCFWASWIRIPIH
jgi:hypothetical protein